MRKCAFGKCALWTLAVATGLIGAGFFLGFGSHMKTAWNNVSKQVKSSVPPDFEIARLRTEINGLDKDLSGNFDALANETVAVKRLKEYIGDMQARLEKQKTVVLKLRRDLATGAQRVSYGGVEYSADELRDTLAREFDAYKAAEEAIKAKEVELKARQQGLDAGRAKIDAMRSAKEKLSAELAKIEAEYKRVQVTQVRSEFQVDDSHLARIKNSMKDLRDRIDAMKIKGDMEAQFTHESIVDKVEKKAKADEVLKEVDAHFGTAKEPARVAADKDDQ
jgi:chromosome segregation ATPase